MTRSLFWMTSGILIVGLAFSGCGPQSGRALRSSANDSTGFSNDEGVSYGTNGDVRVTQTREFEERIAENTGTPVAAPATAPKLRTRIHDIEISRFAKDGAQPSRFGDHHMHLRVFFTDQNPVDFVIALTSGSTRSRVSAESQGYVLSGFLDDNQPLESLGDFTLIKASAPLDTANLLYRAYASRTPLTATDLAGVAGPSPSKQAIEELRRNTYGWAQNWAIVGGRSFYTIDVVQSTRLPEVVEKSPPTAPPEKKTEEKVLLTVRGESLQTEKKPQPAVVTKAPVETKAVLKKNTDSTGTRVFEITMQDPQSTQPVTVELTVQPNTWTQRLPALPKPDASTAPAVAPTGTPSGVTTPPPRLQPAPRLPTPVIPPTPRTDPKPAVSTPVAVPRPRPRPNVPAPTSTPAPAPRPRPVTPAPLAPRPRPHDLKIVETAPKPVPTPTPTTPTPPARAADTPSARRGDNTYMYIRAVDPSAYFQAPTYREPLTTGMCMFDSQDQVQVRRGHCATLWDVLTQPGPVRQFVTSMPTPTDMADYCPSYEALRSDPTKRALVFLALFSATLQQESQWVNPANNHGLWQITTGDRINYPAGCSQLIVNNESSNLRCGAYIALYNMNRGQRISAPAISTFAMSHYFGSVQQGRLSQKKIRAKVRAACQAIARTAL